MRPCRWIHHHRQTSRSRPASGDAITWKTIARRTGAARTIPTISSHRLTNTWTVQPSGDRRVVMRGPLRRAATTGCRSGVRRQGSTAVYDAYKEHQSSSTITNSAPLSFRALTSDLAAPLRHRNPSHVRGRCDRWTGCTSGNSFWLYGSGGAIRWSSSCGPTAPATSSRGRLLLAIEVTISCKGVGPPGHIGGVVGSLGVRPGVRGRKPRSQRFRASKIDPGNCGFRRNTTERRRPRIRRVPGNLE